MGTKELKRSLSRYRSEAKKTMANAKFVHVRDRARGRYDAYGCVLGLLETRGYQSKRKAKHGEGSQV